MYAEGEIASRTKRVQWSMQRFQGPEASCVENKLGFIELTSVRVYGLMVNVNFGRLDYLTWDYNFVQKCLLIVVCSWGWPLIFALYCML